MSRFVLWCLSRSALNTSTTCDPFSGMFFVAHAAHWHLPVPMIVWVSGAFSGRITRKPPPMYPATACPCASGVMIAPKVSSAFSLSQVHPFSAWCYSASEASLQLTWSTDVVILATHVRMSLFVFPS